jgi:hypothetical protein
VHAWQQLPRLRDPERWDAWLDRLIVNACSSRYEPGMYRSYTWMDATP